MRKHIRWVVAGVVAVLTVLAGLLAAVPAGAATNNSGACIGYCPGGIGPDKDTRYTYVPITTLNQKPENAGAYNGDLVYTFGYVETIGTGTGRCGVWGGTCPPPSNLTQGDGDVHLTMVDQYHNTTGGYSEGLILEADPTGTLRYSSLPNLTDNCGGTAASCATTPHHTNCIVAWGFYRWDQGEPPGDPGIAEIHPLVGWHYTTDSRCGSSTLGSSYYTETHGTSGCVAYCTTTGNGEYDLGWLVNLNCEPRAYYLADPTGTGCDYGPRVTTDAFIESDAYDGSAGGQWTLEVDNGPAKGNQYPVQAVVEPEEYWSFSYWTGTKSISVGGSSPTEVCLYGNLRYNYQIHRMEIKPLVGMVKKSEAPGGSCQNVN